MIRLQLESPYLSFLTIITTTSINNLISTFPIVSDRESDFTTH